ncbi:MAG: thiamine phosphate synthase [Dissulfurispiraceae bacterium]
MNEIDFNLYLITDGRSTADRSSLLLAVGEALRAGIKAVQLREKGLSTRDVLSTAYQMRALTARYGAKLFINDRVDIALCVGADGVHLGKASLPAFAVRKIAGKRFLIGVSTHTVNEALIAQKQGADFITLGPVYRTPSKLKYGSPIGEETLIRANAKISIPIFGIGGIKPHNIQNVIQCGAFGIAAISGILGEGDIKAAGERYLTSLKVFSHASVAEEGGGRIAWRTK